MRFAILLSFIFFLGCQPEQQTYSDVQIAGAMRQVMWNGELEGKISLDSLASEGYYGIGPLSYLKGELLLNDGKVFVAQVSTDSTMIVEEKTESSAPFFVYAKVKEWEERELPICVRDQKTLESYLDEETLKQKRPFAFKLVGQIERATIHLQNLPDGTKVSSPQEAHQGQTNYDLVNRQVEIIGFFSTAHKGVFTHHDSFIHLHLVTTDQKMMGHVDEIEFGDMKLLLPVQ
jgi:acetolactate decarboxylase